MIKWFKNGILKVDVQYMAYEKFIQCRMCMIVFSGAPKFERIECIDDIGNREETSNLEVHRGNKLPHY